MGLETPSLRDVLEPTQVMQLTVQSALVRGAAAGDLGGTASRYNEARAQANRAAWRISSPALRAAGVGAGLQLIAFIRCVE